MYKICVFLFFLQMAVAKPQGGVNIPPGTTVVESTTKNDVELLTDGTTKAENNSSEAIDISSDQNTTTDSAATSASVNSTTTHESSSSEGSTSEDTAEVTTDENCNKANEEVIEIVIEPLLPYFFKK
ncbi:hypothetical protein CBL_13124 [Carabus blaptoides fortunei]